MPLVWMPPEVFTICDDIVIYHAYSGSIRLDFKFTTDALERPHFQFDVRALPTWEDNYDVLEAIQDAAKRDLLRIPGGR